MTIVSNNRKSYPSPLLMEIITKVHAKLLQEQPMPPMLAQQIAKEKAVLQQMTSTPVRKGTKIEFQDSPLASEFFQTMIRQGVTNTKEIMSRFDQYVKQPEAIKKLADVGMQQALTAKKPVPAPTIQAPTTGTRGALPGEGTYDPKDPFGVKAKEERVKAQQALIAKRQEEKDAPQQIASKPGELSDFEKKLAAKKKIKAEQKSKMMKEGNSIVSRLIDALVQHAYQDSQDTDGGSSSYGRFRRRNARSFRREDLEYIDELYMEIKDLIYRLRNLLSIQERNPTIKNAIGSKTAWKLVNAIRSLESASQSIETSLTNKVRSANQRQRITRY